MTYPNKETVAQIRREFPAGARVECVKLEDPYTAIDPGATGTVDFVDDTGTIFVVWDNGSTLGAVYSEDFIKKIPRMTETLKEQILSVRASGACNMVDCNAVQKAAFSREFYELVDFIETDRKAYVHFIFTGESL